MPVRCVINGQLGLSSRAYRWSLTFLFKHCYRFDRPSTLRKVSPHDLGKPGNLAYAFSLSIYLYIPGKRVSLITVVS